jgi:hypothetical protein
MEVASLHAHEIDRHWKRWNAIACRASKTIAARGRRLPARSRGRAGSSQRSSSSSSRPGFFDFAAFSKPLQPGTRGLGSRPPGGVRQNRAGRGGAFPNFAPAFSELRRTNHTPERTP